MGGYYDLTMVRRAPGGSHEPRILRVLFYYLTLLEDNDIHVYSI